MRRRSDFISTRGSRSTAPSSGITAGSVCPRPGLLDTLPEWCPCPDLWEGRTMELTMHAVQPQPPGPIGSEFAPLFAAEDRHFWFRARNRVLSALLRTLTASLPAGYRALEVGCGNGNVLRVLEQVCHRGEVIGLDHHEERLHYARQRVRCQLVQADIDD